MVKGRLVWAEINLDHLSYNFKKVNSVVGKTTKIMAIVKANAYGHGAIEFAKQVDKLGAAFLGVVCLQEAIQLRESGITKPILILNYTDPSSVEEALMHNITLNVMDESVLKVVNKFGRKHKRLINIHIKIDSGMHRLGLLPQKALKFIGKSKSYKNVFIQGIFTHFATSDEKNLEFARQQLTLFRSFVSKLENMHFSPPYIHCANSAAALRIPDARFNLIRPGIILYGLAPSSDFILPFQPKPILTLKTIIAQIRKIKKGETVGYGRTFIASRDTFVAALPVGYADGLRRAPVNYGNVLVKGLKAPILGRVSMDQTSIDITGIPNVREGDEVVIIGTQSGVTITADDVARLIGTINYEVIASLAARVSRIYI